MLDTAVLVGGTQRTRGFQFLMNPHFDLDSLKEGKLLTVIAPCDAHLSFESFVDSLWQRNWELLLIRREFRGKTPEI